MSITIKEDRTGTVHKHSRAIEFEGAEPQRHYAYSHRGKLFIPDYASTGWDHGKEPTTIFIRGPLVKKDGTPGNVHVDFKYRTPANRYWGDERSTFDGAADAPAWLLELFGIDLPDTTDKTGLGALEAVLHEFGPQ